MSGYNMASMHSKWSKHVAIPAGDRWGIPAGTSVADCLNWNHRPTPPPQPKSQIQLLKEETKEKRTYITRTPQPPSDPWSGEANGEAVHEFVTSSSHTVKERPPTPYNTVPVMESMEVRDEPEGFRLGVSGTPVPGTVRTRPKSAVVYSSTKLETPPSFRERIQTPNGRRSPKKSVRERAPTPPMSFRNFLYQRQQPPTPDSDRYRTLAAQLDDEKYGGYPHYHAPPTPENVEYIVNQTQRNMVERSLSPGPRATGRGINPKYTVNGHKSLVPASTEDILREKALINAMREHLFNNQNRSGNPSGKPPTGRTPPKYQAASRNEDTRISEYQRPNSTGHADFYKTMYKDSPAAMKMVGFSPQDEYHTYEAYNSRMGTPQPREAWNGSADHFKEWRETTKQMARQGTPHRMDKYRNVRSKVDHRWKHGKPSSENPGKVSVEFDCPQDKSDMMVSVRVKNTPVPAY